MDQYFSAFKSNMPWLPERTIFLTRHGSNAYGTAIEGSDLDIKGVAIPPAEYFHGYSKVFAQAQTNAPHDLVVYDIRKFFNLASACNPNIIEVLFTEEEDWLHVNSLGRTLLDHRDLFISKKARWTFSGYATAQLKKIQSHYRWLKSPPTAPPERKDFGLPDNSVIPKNQLEAAHAAIRKRVDGWSLDLTGVDDATRIHILNQVESSLTEFASALSLDVEDGQHMAAATLLGYDSNFLELLDRERKYKVKHNEWVSYQEWKVTRNKARAEIEAKHGYDCKNAMHLVRLLKMCREIMTTGKVIVKRPDREELLAIRNGAWTYEQVVEFSESEDKAMASLYTTSTLPREPNHAALDQLCSTIVEGMIRP